MHKDPKGSLTKEEKKVVKRLLLEGWRNQDIQALLNLGRDVTCNSGRITEVKQDNTIVPSSKDEAEFFVIRKNSYDLKTELNLYDDERLIRAREAMILAVQVFNSPGLNFKTEVFSVLANIAWTYLLHEFYERRGEKIIQADGRSMLLSQMICRDDVPLEQGVKDNLESIKKIRDAVEHTLFRKSDLKFMSVFQACCLNFDRKMVELFGDKKTLKNDLSFALQFAQMDFNQLNELSKFDIPASIEALDQSIEEGLGEKRLQDMNYRFRVSYTFENATKSKAHIKFLHPDAVEAGEVRNVLIKKELSDKAYPFKPNIVVARVREKTGLHFTSHNHTQAWRKFDARPRGGVKQPENTNSDFCVYHQAHGDYTYSEKWVEFLSNYIRDEANFVELKAYKLS